MKSACKKFLIILIGFLNGYAYAQTPTWVTIPDSNFVTYLQATIPSAMQGNQLNTSSTLVTVNTQTIDVSAGNISDLNGIQYFLSLTYLDCNYNLLTSLPVLPHTLSYLDCGGNQLTKN